MEPTLAELLAAIGDLSTRLSLMADAVDDIRLNLTSHRRDQEQRLTAVDLALRSQVVAVQDAVDAFAPEVTVIRGEQAAQRANIADALAKLDAVQANQAELDINLSAKLDDIRSRVEPIGGAAR